MKTKWHWALARAGLEPRSLLRALADLHLKLDICGNHAAQFSIFSPLIRLNAWSFVTSTAPNAKA
jgi:hypothetical protein